MASNDNFIYYKINSTAMLKDKVLLVKNNRITGENIIFEFKHKLKLNDQILNSFVNYKNGKFTFLTDVYHYSKGLFKTYKQTVDTASMTSLEPIKQLEYNNFNPYELLPNSIISELEQSNSRIDNTYFKDKSGNIYYAKKQISNDLQIMKVGAKITFVPFENKQSNELLLNLPNDLNILSCQLSINNKNEIVCVGLYANPGLISAVGCYSIIVDSKLTKVKSCVTNSFSNELITKGLNEKEAETMLSNIISNKEFDNDFKYFSSKIYFNKDDGYTIAIDKYKSKWTRNFKISTGYSEDFFYYYYGDVYVLSFNNDGSLNWSQKIHRNADVMEGSQFAGEYFLKHNQNNEMFFIFNNIKSNTSKTYCVKIDYLGKEQIKTLESESNISKYICPAFFKSYDANSIIAVKYNYLEKARGLGLPKNTITFGILKLNN
jgi:hypothetical protein